MIDLSQIRALAHKGRGQWDRLASTFTVVRTDAARATISVWFACHPNGGDTCGSWGCSGHGTESGAEECAHEHKGWVEHAENRGTCVADKVDSDVPSGWIILNAPRPLLEQDTWEGDWCHGRHYAAIDPTDSMASVYLRKSLDLDGWVVDYIGQAEIDAHVEAMCEKYPDSAEWIRESPAKDKRQSYFQAHQEMVVPMEVEE